MFASSRTSVRRRQPDSPRNPEIDANSVRPYGPAGVGLITGHPVGLVVAVGIVILTLIALPPARIFFLGSLLAGGIVGLILWLSHR